ncbi:MAG: hypothetical protein M3R24_03350 [Chloroflexota bacterium]|nr:hypothetical protein [Chloroflexota bacterium]
MIRSRWFAGVFVLMGLSACGNAAPVFGDADAVGPAVVTPHVGATVTAQQMIDAWHRRPRLR